MRSHFSLNQGVAAACAVAGAATMLSGNCPAQTYIAADYATNSAYASGWFAGTNGGYGWGAWSMNGTEATSPNEHAMDRGGQHNPFGVAWTLYNPEGTHPAPTSPGSGCVNPPLATDISRAGRAMPNGRLRPGDTFSTLIANPTGRTFWKGYTIVFSNGSDNIGYGGVSRLDVGTFEYFTYGRWYQAGANGDNRGYTGTPLFDTDTTTNGMRLDVTLTTTNSYHLVMTPLGSPENAYTYDGYLKGGTTNEPITWVTYQLYNTDSNFYPTPAPCGPDRTDFYIQSMTVAGLTLEYEKAGSDLILRWPEYLSTFALESTPNLGPGANWQPVSPPPVVVDHKNVVTNAIGTQQFYRLKQ